MPISLRLPIEVEEQISGFGERLGISKTAVIVRSIQEYLAQHAQPTSQQIYEEAVRDAQATSVEEDARYVKAEKRPRKLPFRAAIMRKHASRRILPAAKRVAAAQAKKSAGSARKAA